MRLLIALPLLCILICCNSQKIANNRNKIDDINSAVEANAFLHGILDSNYKDYFIPTRPDFKEGENKMLANKLKIATWTKADFDRNGFTDLLVMATDTSATYSEDNRYVACIMDSGSNRFFVKALNTELFGSFALAVANLKDTVPEIILYQHAKPNFYVVGLRGDTLPHDLIVDTLIFKFGDFIELNRLPRNYEVKKIEFDASTCFGTCPSFELILNSDRTAEYNAKFYNHDRHGKEVTGHFTSMIDQPQFEKIVTLLNYINFPKLESSYAVGWTDDQTGDLKITYGNGKINLIHDYGMEGTFSLMQLYNLLFALRLAQNWH